MIFSSFIYPSWSSNSSLSNNLDKNCFTIIRGEEVKIAFCQNVNKNRNLCIGFWPSAIIRDLCSLIDWHFIVALSPNCLLNFPQDLQDDQKGQRTTSLDVHHLPVSFRPPFLATFTLIKVSIVLLSCLLILNREATLDRLVDLSSYKYLSNKYNYLDSFMKQTFRILLMCIQSFTQKPIQKPFKCVFTPHSFFHQKKKFQSGEVEGRSSKIYYAALFLKCWYSM